MSIINEQINLHWDYNEGVLNLTLSDTLTKDEVIELCKYFYIESMKHGYGHGFKKDWKQNE